MCFFERIIKIKITSLIYNILLMKIEQIKGLYRMINDIIPQYLEMDKKSVISAKHQLLRRYTLCECQQGSFYTDVQELRFCNILDRKVRRT